MAELSAKEYWLLKEIEEEFLECVDPCDLLSYVQVNLRDPPWKEMTWRLISDFDVDSKDLIAFDNVVHMQIYWLSAISNFTKTQIKRQLPHLKKYHSSSVLKLLIVETYILLMLRTLMINVNDFCQDLNILNLSAQNIH